MRLKTAAIGRFGKRFSQDRKGSVATIAAVALIPIVIAVGAGLDVSRAISSKAQLQDALDATALALAKLPAGTPNATLTSKGQTWLTANLVNSGLGQVNLTVVPSTGKLVLDADSNVPTVMSSMAGLTNVNVKAHTEINWGSSHIELALVLDNTGSMGQNSKLQTLKTAANNLVDKLFATSDTTDVNALKISVVPFSMTVRLSSNSSQLSTYQSAAWMAGALPYNGTNSADLFYNGSGVALTGTNRFTLFSNLGKSWAGCVESRPAPYDVQDTAPATATPNTLFVPYFYPDEPDHDTVIKSTNYWGTSYYDFGDNYQGSNYINDDRTGNNYTSATSGANSYRIRQGRVGKYAKSTTSGDGPNQGCTGLQALLRLSNSKTTIKNKITAMTASGNTNVPFGMMWGWHTLSPNLPFADGVAYNNPDTKKIMVVLTDGDNVNTNDNTPNAGAYSGIGYIWQRRLSGATETSSDGQRTTAMDARMGVLCTNAKAAGITIYTVRIDVSGAAPPELMNCASSPDKFFDLPDPNDLADAFDVIAGSIGKLRIAK